MLVHKKGDLFSAPPGSILAHACNCKGVWGSGVAVGFREKFPEAHIQYMDFCKDDRPRPGSFALLRGGSHWVGCLFTSQGYGAQVDSPEKILEATQNSALQMLCSLRSLSQSGLLLNEIPEIHTPKFNSGLFRVPWADTEKVLLQVLEDFPEVTWTVWDNG